jgi:alpha,alpha-trehalase
VPHPFIIPGARFRECYYWDTYWAVEGLLASGLAAAARGCVLNLLHLVEDHGFVPNGTRTYYLNRSQPPLLARAVAALHAAAPLAPAELARALAALRRERAFWAVPPRGVTVRGAGGALHRLSRYRADWDAPRPESFAEDTATAAGAADPRALYRELASAAESGWDFSSRWLADGVSLATARTTSIIPADLTALLLALERTAAALAAELGDAAGAAELSALADSRQVALDELHWDEGAGQWRDLLMVGRKGAGGGTEVFTVERSTGVYASNWVPLWCGAASPGSRRALAAVAALAASGLAGPGGVAASAAASGPQWDAPNAWPPLQAMLVAGCREAGGAPGAALAEDLARRFLRGARAGWAARGAMFEKYDARAAGGAPGGGGEYAVVAGFGWTNGAALELLARYGWPVEEEL